MGSVEEFASYVQGIDSRFRAFQNLRKNNSASNQHSDKPKDTRSASAAPANPTYSNSGYTGPAPMDLSAARRNLTDEERRHRMAKGLCLYCGGAGHMLRECPNRKSPRQPMRVSEVSFVSPAPDTNSDMLIDLESKN